MELIKKSLNFILGMILLLGFYFVSFFLVKFLNIPLPPAILGIILLAFSLTQGLIKEKYIKSVCDFLIKYMALFLVPFMGGLVVHKPLLTKNWFVILVVIFITTTLTIVLTGLFVEYGLKFIRLKRMKHHND